ncbi:hypothetical protein BU15DRAFT_70944 [Melanogaster broomeanus]|nr:hypothetical protein BU15DRAFT_70944 [Melanogaster broomeanus]
MTLIVLDHYTYQLGTRTPFVGLVALLCGLLGCLMSVLALGIFFVVPTVGPQSPPILKGKRWLLPPAHPTQLNALGVSLEPAPSKLEKPQISHNKALFPPLRRPASFPSLHKTDSQQSYRPLSTQLDLEIKGTSKSISPVSLGFPSPTSPPTIQRRWSSAACPYIKLRSTSPDNAHNVASPRVQDLPLSCFDQECKCHSRVGKLGLLMRSSSPEPSTTSPKTSPRRSSIASTDMSLPQKRLSQSNTRRSLSVSCKPTLVELDEDDDLLGSTSVRPKLNLPPRPSGETYRAGFINPFTKRSISSSQSPLSISDPLPKCRMPSSPPSGPSLHASCTDSPLSSRRKPANKFPLTFNASAGASHVAESSSSPPIVVSMSIVQTVKSRFRKKPVARTQPYGPPWNAPMPGQTFLEPCAPRIVSGQPHQTTAETVDTQTLLSSKRNRKSPKHDS